MAPSPSGVTLLLPLPFDEAIRYWQRRAGNLLPSFAWQDVWQQEHARAFTVAKGLQLDVLGDIRDALDQAIRNGTTFEQFKAGLIPLLQQKGWWGTAPQTDPLTGETKLVQLGSPRRLKTIFDVNLRTSVAAGRWEQIQRVKAARPWLRYVAVMDGRTRPEHAAWHGTILPVDNAWWHDHYPPNGWNCRCRVVQLSDRDLQRMGMKPSAEAPPSPEVPWTNKRTGETVEVPQGIDPGFAYNVGIAGAEAEARLVLAQKVAATAVAHPELAAAAVRDLVASPDFDRWMAKPAGPFPVMVLPDPVAQAIGARAPTAMLSSDTLAKNLAHHPELTVEEYRQLPAMGAAPDLVMQDGPNTVVIVRHGDAVYWAAVKATKTGLGTFVTSFRRTRKSAIGRLLAKAGTRVLLGDKADWEG